MPSRPRSSPRVVALGALVAVLVAASPVLARPGTKALTLNDVIARAKAAAEFSSSTKTEIEDWDLVAEGLSGTQTIARRGRDFTVTTRLGPFLTERGRAANQPWHQDENGVTVLDHDRSERVTAHSLERVSTPVEAYVVLETLASGHVLRSYYDPRTFVLLRREKWVAGRFSYTAWDDFHTETSGHIEAWHYKGEDSDGTVFEYRMRSERDASSGEITPFTVPRSRRVVDEFPTGQHFVRLPARFDRHRILVRVGVGRRSYDFLLDSGASGIVVGSEVARQQGLEIYGSGSAKGAAAVASGRVIAPQLEVGALRLHDVVMRTAPLGEEERRDHIAGFLGFDFFSSAVLRIDFERGTLDAYEPGSFAAPLGSTIVDVRLNNQVPETGVRVGDSAGDNFLVDTGAATTLLVFSHFARAHPSDVADDGVGALLASSGIGIAANGIGGRIGLRPVRVKRFRFGRTVFDEPLVYLADSPYALGLDTADGLVGADVLSRFTVYFDYWRSRILLEPPR